MWHTPRSWERRGLDGVVDHVDHAVVSPGRRRDRPRHRGGPRSRYRANDQHPPRPHRRDIGSRHRFAAIIGRDGTFVRVLGEDAVAISAHHRIEQLLIDRRHRNHDPTCNAPTYTTAPITTHR